MSEQFNPLSLKVPRSHATREPDVAPGDYTVTFSKVHKAERKDDGSYSVGIDALFAGLDGSEGKTRLFCTLPVALRDADGEVYSELPDGANAKIYAKKDEDGETVWVPASFKTEMVVSIMRACGLVTDEDDELDLSKLPDVEGQDAKCVVKHREWTKDDKKGKTAEYAFEAVPQATKLGKRASRHR